MLGVRLYFIQRLTALLMAPLVAGHLAVMIYAVRGGLSSAELLNRTQGSLFWALFYGLFVAAVSIHAAIGLRVVAFEMFDLRGKALSVFTSVVCLLLLMLGFHAVLSVTLS